MGSGNYFPPVVKLHKIQSKKFLFGTPYSSMSKVTQYSLLLPRTIVFSFTFINSMHPSLGFLHAAYISVRALWFFFRHFSSLHDEGIIPNDIENFMRNLNIIKRRCLGPSEQKYLRVNSPDCEAAARLNSSVNLGECARKGEKCPN